MPRGARPAPLPDAAFRAKLEGQIPGEPGEGDARGPAALLSGEVPEEIPVHNTFIQFGSPASAESEKQQPPTAPASFGPSFQSMIQSAAEAPGEPVVGEPAAPLPPPPEEDDGWSAVGSPKRAASPRKLPVMRYSLSASSARAAGVPALSAVVACYEPEGGWLSEPLMDSTAASAAGSASASAAQALGARGPSLGGGGGGHAARAGSDEDDEGDSGGGGEGRRVRHPCPLPVPPGPPPSVGSEGHTEGLCKRCCFFPKGRCNNDADCEFCHYDHEKRKRKKKKKGKQKEGGSDDDAGGVVAATATSTTATTASKSFDSGAGALDAGAEDASGGVEAAWDAAAHAAWDVAAASAADATAAAAAEDATATTAASMVLAALTSPPPEWMSAGMEADVSCSLGALGAPILGTSSARGTPLSAPQRRVNSPLPDAGHFAPVPSTAAAGEPVDVQHLFAAGVAAAAFEGYAASDAAAYAQAWAAEAADGDYRGYASLASYAGPFGDFPPSYAAAACGGHGAGGRPPPR